MKKRASLALLFVVCLIFSSCADEGFDDPLLPASPAASHEDTNVTELQTTAVETTQSVETTALETTQEETVADESQWQDVYRQVLQEKVTFLKEREEEYGPMLYGS